MTEGILDALGPVLTRWTMGGTGAGAAPASWHEALGNDPREAELRLLALAGQYLGTLTCAEPSGALRAKGDLPRLSLPPVPDALRPQVRRVLRQPDQRRDLLDFLSVRGWTMHPADWMPGPHEDVPPAYAPWQDWAAQDVPRDQATDTVESWDDLGPAGRRTAFAAFRRQDAAAAGAFLADRIGAEPADMRVRLLELLAAALSDADVPLLEGLVGDRAPRVKALAAALLARLGHGAAQGEDIAELAAFFAVQTRGMIKRTRVITAQTLKTPTQRMRRSTLMEAALFDAFAQGLGLSSTELVAAWPWHDDRLLDHALAGMAARSAPDGVVRTIAEALTGATVDPHSLSPLLPRLSLLQRREAALRLLRARGGSFVLALTLAGPGEIDDPIRTTTGTALIEALKSAAPAEQAAELLALGLIASRAGAEQALVHLGRVGMTTADPHFDMLRLNAALDNTGARE